MTFWKYMVGAFIGVVLVAFWVPFSVQFLPHVWWSWSVCVIVGVLAFGGPTALGAWWATDD